MQSATLSNHLLQGLTFSEASFHNCSVTFNIGTQAAPTTGPLKKTRRVMIEDDFDND